MVIFINQIANEDRVMFATKPDRAMR